MPKIVSHCIVSSSDQTNETSSGQHPLLVYYCLCSEFILVIDMALERLPRRQTDRAFIVDNTKRTYKLTAEQGTATILQR
ncbi:UPF0428 protein CXorf56-like protein [Jimgerdemannia flammicorona]|uniref:UPF0428 protein CXorf56-like protein n=2 Tax=Jimgerdemannia flammicorona TaxID=994334 RepID=A0A433QZL9_9FUNG|nr:UPF0428 protein CXorf56-like protein [Jimgerdemannia flammicorona]RUS35222.1 UPF0428 protein CXorf56-like protein [Jimgerdemannia flammicorona]